MRWKLDLLQWPETKRVPSGSMLALPDSRSKSTRKLLMIPFFYSTGMIYMHWVLTGQTVNKEYYVDDFKGVQEEIPWKEASTLQIRSVAFPPG